MSKILITGGTGFIGSQLVEFLLRNGYEVVCLNRKVKINTRINSFQWDIEQFTIDENAFVGVDHIVHLAGAGIADKRWTKARKMELENSRIRSTQLLWEGLRRSGVKIKTFVGASAVGYYGAVTNDHVYAENDPAGKDFIAGLCERWENSYDVFKEANIPTYILRIGMVLSWKGGALPRMSRFFKLGLGSAIGTGKQIMPWIHLKDLIRIIESCIHQKLPSGIYNAVAPEKVTNEQFSNKLAKVLQKPLIMPKIPVLLMKIVFGEMAVILLEGSEITTDKLRSTGFKFQFEKLKLSFRTK